ncbi:short-chain dehydrogenase/reductase SDR [Histoplasma capsulatum G186AR]|uniref:Short-chain dehydrogenase/reductase SDR n=1 Tax=Ajellomyces capsulatus (strain G186AR / H82 / ATCC MYA-2454 / RMSCC 2432) TaxID=447093 RepID=C0NJ18_AJECG|nr:short-chain dehydrogenase/reductase SDR [Histoplasma capsulatum G186AR]EEH07859.1 short-chain dehydrogenase/reductase SDR [Histoplasma capsulatum G186AR]
MAETTTISSDPPSRSLAGKDLHRHQRRLVITCCALVTASATDATISTLLAHDGCYVICLDRNLDWASRGVEMIEYAVPATRRNEGEEVKGDVVNMGSVAGLKGGMPHLLYPMDKGAVVNMTRAMAAHHAVDGIKVNCVCPGMLYTPMMYGRGMTEEA